jgi:hypothetical protein
MIVKCINNSIVNLLGYGQQSVRFLTVGKIYKVLSEESGCYRIIDDEGNKFGYRKERFEKVWDMLEYYEVK